MKRETIRLLVSAVAAGLAGATSNTLGAPRSGELRGDFGRPIPREVEDDPYLPGPGEPPPTLVERSGPVVRDYFVSVQVNVDEFGQNIPGDAANEPSIAVDPTDPHKIVIGWRQFYNVASNHRQAGWAYSHDNGQTWTFPGTLEPGRFRSDPVLDADAEGNFYYYSLSSVTSAELFKSTDGGLSWTGPIPGFGGDKAWMTIDRTGGIGHGNIYAAWNLEYSCCDGDFTRSTDGGQTFLPPIVVPESPYWGTLAVGLDGKLYESGAGIVLARSTNARDPTATPTFDFANLVDLGGDIEFGAGPNPGGLLGQVWVATDHSDGPGRGNVYLFASVNPPNADPLDVMFARSLDRGLSWSPPVRVNNDPMGSSKYQWFGTMSVAPNGRIDAIWNDTRNGASATISELFYAYSWDEGVTWLGNVPVSPPFDSYVGWPNQNKLGDYYDMVSDEVGAKVAYAATFNGEQDVYYLRLAPDCNGNDVPDSQDIANGTATDCNLNRIPDACDLTEELSPDCNANAVPDECDAVFHTVASSPQLSPIGDGSPQSYTFELPGDAATDVVLTFTASGDFSGGVSESVDIFINDVVVPVGNVFSGDAGDCSNPPDVDELVIDTETFNSAVAGGDAVIHMVTTSWVNANPPACEFPTYITVSLAYGVVGTSLDCNLNSVPDECEGGDFDGNGQLDLSDAGDVITCLTGPCPAPPCAPPWYPEPCCLLADFDKDGDSDLADFSFFQTQFSAL